MKTMREAHFVPQWINMETEVPEPRIDWIDNKYLDLAYGEEPLQKLDLYLPEGSGPFPLMVLVHGGGFCMCDKRDWHLYPGFYALKKGFALASVNYRLAPAVQFPAPVDDIKAAIRYLRKNADKYSLSPSDVYLYGTSAGGNLVSLTGLQNAGTSEAVSGVASLCGLVDFENQWKFYNQFEAIAPEYVAACKPMLATYLGASPEENAASAKKAGAQEYITKEAPPFYIQHGTMDPAVPVEQSYNLARQLRDVCGEDAVTLDLLDGVGHAGGGPEYLEKDNIVPILEFFERCRRK